jgi:lipopolysaccharide/colanic/teichoic acid biosynthesis glycosyltransferase
MRNIERPAQPSSSASFRAVTKRLFDVAASAIGLLCVWPLFLLVAVLIKTDSRGPVFFIQERMGRRYRPFRILKFRTMSEDAPMRGRSITCGDDPRITHVGRVLRATKIDELPQLINVIRGDMSLVGPRPELPRYVASFPDDYDEILTVRPGLTDLASIKFHDEAAILGRASHPEEMYLTQILPEKIALGKEYVRSYSFISDLLLILKTISMLAGKPPIRRIEKTSARSIQSSEGRKTGIFR